MEVAATEHTNVSDTIIIILKLNFKCDNHKLHSKLHLQSTTSKAKAKLEELTAEVDGSMRLPIPLLLQWCQNFLLLSKYYISAAG